MARQIGSVIGALLLLAGLTGCSDDGSAEAPGSPAPSSSTAQDSEPDPSGTPTAPSSSSTPGADDDTGPDGDIPEGCDLTNDRLAVLARDWQRVVGSIGRGDHDTYTGAFAREVDRLQDRAQGCPGASDLEQFAGLAARIDERAGDPDLGLYAEAVRAGDAWLGGLGFENLRLAPS